jgi:uracil phosphoribosyltransferase
VLGEPPAFRVSVVAILRSAISMHPRRSREISLENLDHVTVERNTSSLRLVSKRRFEFFRQFDHHG